MTKTKTFFLLFLAVFILSACEEKLDQAQYRLEFSGEENITPTNLRDTIISYYTAENNSAWSIAYSLRSDAFRKLVPYDTYEKEMEKGMGGWNLIKVEVLSESESPNKEEKIFEIRFSERFGGNTLPNNSSDEGVQTNVEKTIWEYIGGTWVCIQAGQRGHLPLNVKMVYE